MVFLFEAFLRGLVGRLGAHQRPAAVGLLRMGSKEQQRQKRVLKGGGSSMSLLWPRAPPAAGKEELRSVLAAPDPLHHHNSPRWPEQELCRRPQPRLERHRPSVRVTVSATSVGSDDLRFLLHTERPLGDQDIGEVILPLAEILAGAGEEPTVKAGESAVGHLAAGAAPYVSAPPQQLGASQRGPPDRA